MEFYEGFVLSKMYFNILIFKEYNERLAYSFCNSATGFAFHSMQFLSFQTSRGTCEHCNWHPSWEPLL